METNASFFIGNPLAGGSQGQAWSTQRMYRNSAIRVWAEYFKERMQTKDTDVVDKPDTLMHFATV